MSSFARSGRKFVETGRREFQKRLRGDAVSFLITTAPGSADLAQNLVRNGRPVRGARNREMMRATITGTWLVSPPVLYFVGVRLQVLWTMTPRRRVFTCCVIVMSTCKGFLGRRVRDPGRSIRFKGVFRYAEPQFQRGVSKRRLNHF